MKISELFKTKTSSNPSSTIDKQNSSQIIDLSTATKTPIKHGTVAIINERLIVTDPEGEGSLATLVIPESTEIQVIVDGKQVLGSITLQSAQSVEIKSMQRAPERRLTLVPSADKLNLIAQTLFQAGVDYRYKSTSVPANRLALEVEETPIPPQPFTADEIRNELAHAGFVGTIDEASLASLTQATSTTELVLMHGTPMDPGEAARYDAVHLKKPYDPLHLQMQIQTVTLGTVIANLHPGRPGTPGRDILDVEIPVPKLPPLPTLGSGVLDVSGRLLATRGGRLIFTSNLIDVVPILTFEHDISPKDGQVIFEGDVLVGGSVLDGSLIKATGKVVILGNVMNAKIVAEHGIRVHGNITGSTLLAGQMHVLYRNLKPVLDDIMTNFQSFERNCDVLRDEARKHIQTRSKVDLIPSTLLQNKYPFILNALQSLVDNYTALTATDSAFKEITHVLRARWIGIQSTTISPEDVQGLRMRLRDYLAYIEGVVSTEWAAHTTVGSATSSTIHSTGNVCVVGKGLYGTNIQSEKCILVKKAARGSSLSAERAVFVYELGSEAAAESSAHVKRRDGTIYVGVRHPNTILSLGTLQHRCYRYMEYAYYQGRLPDHTYLSV